jgi:hypothetical protein
MNNFLEFIQKDIEVKKKELSLMPVKSKKSKKVYNDTLKKYSQTYKNYKEDVLKYMKVKLKKMTSKSIQNKEEIDRIEKEIINFEFDIKFFNAKNTYYEKLNLENYIYILEHFDEFNYKQLVKNIESLLYKFDEVGVEITKDDFFYNVYVCKYMEAFLKVRKDDKKYESLLGLFEEYYWIDSNLIYNIGLNFREIINKYRRFFMKTVDVTRLEIVNRYDVSSFHDCEVRLDGLFKKLHEHKIENVGDIIEKSKNGEIDIRNYLEGSKMKDEIINELQIVQKDFEDHKEKYKFYNNIAKLKEDLTQYISYIEYLPVLNILKQDYNEYIKEPQVAYDPKNLDELEKKKIVKEKLLKRYKNELLTSNILFKKKNNIIEKDIIEKTLAINKELKEIYDQIHLEKVKQGFVDVVKDSVTMYDVLFFCYSQEHYKRQCLNRAFPNMNHKELIKKIKSFDFFTIDPTLALIDNIPFLREYNLEQVIINKHRLNNIKIEEADLKDAETMLEKVNFLLREKIVAESDMKAEEIDFITKLNAIVTKEET